MFLATLLFACAGHELLPLHAALTQGGVPGAEWRRIAVADVEGGADYARFGDAFDGTPTQEWRKARGARPYLETAELSDAPTLGEVRGALLALRIQVRTSATFAEGNGPLLRRSLVLELDDVLSRVPSQDDLDRDPLGWEQAKDFVTGRFERETAQLSDDQGDLVTDSMFFPGDSTQVVLRLDRKPALGGSTPLHYFATLEQAIEFRAAAAAVVKIFGVLVAQELGASAQRLRDIDAGWTNYLEHGFSQYPWESWANGWLTDFSWTRPPRSQWVLLHPEVGFVFDTRSSRSAELQTALLVHGVGYVRYFGDTRDWFAGLSATASITGDSAYGLGFGPTLHLGHTRVASRVPHVSVGVMWQDFDVGGRDPVLAATLDLWRLVDRGSDALYEARLLSR